MDIVSKLPTNPFRLTPTSLPKAFRLFYFGILLSELSMPTYSAKSETVERDMLTVARASCQCSGSAAAWKVYTPHVDTGDYRGYQCREGSCHR